MRQKDKLTDSLVAIVDGIATSRFPPNSQAKGLIMVNCMTEEMMDWIPVWVLARIEGYDCRAETKMELLANCCLELESHPEATPRQLLKLARSRLYRERMGRFDAARSYRMGSDEGLAELSYWDKPEEDRDERNEAIFRTVAPVREILNAHNGLGDMLANGLSIRDAARVCGIPKSTAILAVRNARKLIEKF